MRNILSRLLAMNQFDIIIFGDKVIGDERALSPSERQTRSKKRESSYRRMADMRLPH